MSVFSVAIPFLPLNLSSFALAPITGDLGFPIPDDFMSGEINHGNYGREHHSSCLTMWLGKEQQQLVSPPEPEMVPIIMSWEIQCTYTTSTPQPSDCSACIIYTSTKDFRAKIIAWKRSTAG